MREPAGPPRPSFLVRMALRALLPEAERAALLNELHELWERKVVREGQDHARRWYRRQLRHYPLQLVPDRLRRMMRSMAADWTDSREGRGFMEGAVSDARQAVRGWLKSPVMALTIVLTVGLGLGASTAMFAVVRTVLLDALPYPAADRLVRIYHAIGSNRWPLSVADFQAIEGNQTHFEHVAAYTSGERTFTDGEVVERVRVRAVTAGLFDLLGIRAVHGRTFVGTDGELDTPATAMVSWGFWQRYLDGDAAVVGRTIRLDGADFTVIGILPREVGPLEERYSVFPVLQFEPPTRKGPFMLTLVGRLRRETEAAVAAAELRAINSRIFSVWQSGWSDRASTYGVMPLAEFVTGQVRTPLILLLGAVGLVLLVASTNAAGLLTARAVQRRTELATRAALGASRSRLVRLLVTESVLLALAGAALGLVLTAGALRALRSAGPDLIPRAGFIALDGSVLGFAGLLTCSSLVLFGMIPALRLIGTRSGIAETLRAGGRTVTDAASAHDLRRTLVASQFAIAVPLLAGAALLLNSFMNLQRVDPGFDGNQVLTARMSRVAAPADSAPAIFWDQVLERVTGLPGVVAAGLNSGRPPRESSNINNFDLLDRPTPPGQTEPLAVWLVASPGYFDALRIGLVAGRMFDERDGPELENISALVDRRWVENMYSGENPVGRRFYEGGCKSEDCRIVEIVGVVEDVRYLGLDDAQADAAIGSVYVPHSQWFERSMNLFVRTSGEPLQVLGAIREVVRELNPEVPVTDVATAHDLVDDALATPRNLAGAVGAFAAVALLLAMIGIYGVMSYSVAQRSHELGIRCALGASAWQLVGLVVRGGAMMAATGLLIGVVGAFAVTRTLSTLLFEVTPNDPLTLCSVGLMLAGIAMAACWLPARRITRVDPVEALRYE